MSESDLHGCRVIVHFVGMHEINADNVVIYVFNKVRKQIPAKLLLVGDGPERNMCEQLTRELGLDDEIRFVGKQQDMEEIYAIADLFLLPSEYESFGLAALEAMAGGAPVVSSNSGGLPEIITDGDNGFMSDVGDVDSMSRNALAILMDDVILNQFKKHARNTANRFDIQNIVPKYEALYERCLTEWKAP